MDTLTQTTNDKVYGYLEMKNRLTLWRRWKKYWFVLDGKMLLYYKSKEKYEKLGHCKGVLNMSLAQAVRPCSISKSYPLEIVMRPRIVHLSACDEENRQKWLNALLKSLSMPEISAPIMERLSSRLSIGSSLLAPLTYANSEKLEESEDQSMSLKKENSKQDNYKSIHEGQLETIEEPKSEAESTSKNGSNENLDCFRKRSLYEEIVEEVLELTGRKLLDEKEKLVKQENRVSVAKIVPPKPPRAVNRTVSIENNTDNGVPSPKISEKVIYLRVDNKLLDGECEIYESANESCYMTAESSEYEGDTSSLSSSDMPTISQMGSMCNILENNDDNESFQNNVHEFSLQNDEQTTLKRKAEPSKNEPKLSAVKSENYLFLHGRKNDSKLTLTRKNTM